MIYCSRCRARYTLEGYLVGLPRPPAGGVWRLDDVTLLLRNCSCGGTMAIEDGHVYFHESSGYACASKTVLDRVVRVCGTSLSECERALRGYS